MEREAVLVDPTQQGVTRRQVEAVEAAEDPTLRGATSKQVGRALALSPQVVPAEAAELS